MSEILVLTVLIFVVSMIVLGRIKRQKIWNLFALMGVITLIFEFTAYIPFMLGLVTLGVWLVADTFFGGVE